LGALLTWMVSPGTFYPQIFTTQRSAKN